ncbi:MAG: cell wall-binding repeat-containing protein [Euzebya sp.]
MSRYLMVAVTLTLLMALTPGATAQLPSGTTAGPIADPGPVPSGTVVFPTDALTVADTAQATGRRMDLPLPDCTVQISRCNEIALINQLDGFDLLPRVTVTLDSAPAGDLDALFTADRLGVRPVGGGETLGLARLVYDPQTRTLYGEPADQLVSSTAYEVVYQGQATRFTTMTASAGLAQMRRQLDTGAAYDAAGIAQADRQISFVQGDLRTVFAGPEVVRITRYNETIPGGEPVSEMVIDAAIAGAGTVAFGSFESPSWLADGQVIPAAPTRGAGPSVTGSDRIGVTLILPLGTAPDGGWPLAIFGPGITRSKYDLFLAADLNASQGLATMSFDPVGHAFGEGSEVGVQLNSSLDEVRFSGFGRGFDLNNDGIITNQEGVQAPSAPHPVATVGLRDGLRQTAADLMALVRAVQAGTDVDGDGSADLSTDDISIYAQSLGGIYSTMMMGADPAVEVAALNVPGGAILDIAALSPGFREAVAEQLRDRVPGQLNGGINTFTEDIGQFGEPAVNDPVEGALDIQLLLYEANWISRSGSPETFAPLLATRPLSDSRPKKILYQFALGDRTVPNPTSFRLARAFGDDSRVSLYRNDLTLTAMRNPHGFLLDPTIQGRNQAQMQVLDFLLSGGETINDPDLALPTWEAPIADRDILLDRNFPADAYAPATDAPAREVQRVAGDDDIRTAVEVSKTVFDEASTVVIARVDEYADGLAGGPLAALSDAPLLLSDSNALSQPTAEEITRLGAETAILLGGEAALSAQVAMDLEDAGLTVDRVGGDNRFSTAALIAERLGYSSEVLLVEGENADPARGFPDALSAAGIGAGLRQPILLTNATRLPQETIDALSSTQDLTIIGGVVAISDDVEAQVTGLVNQVTRIAGGTRFETSALAADEAILRGLQPTVTWTATGSSFATGLVAGAAAGATNGILLLVQESSLDNAPDVARWLRQHGASVDQAYVVGGQSLVSTATEQGILTSVSG